MSWRTIKMLDVDAIYFIEWDNSDVITSLFNVLPGINNISLRVFPTDFLPVF